MPDKEKKATKPKPSKPEEPGYETVDAPFEAIMDAILEADSTVVKEENKRRRKRG
jgi:hypothetical protein